MAYTPTSWVDEVLAGDELFEILDSSGAAVDAFGDLAQCKIQLNQTITTTGTPVNAANLNKIEQGLVDIHTGAALSIKGNPTNTPNAETQDVVAANDNEVLRRSGTSIGFGKVANAGLADPYDHVYFEVYGLNEEIIVADGIVRGFIVDTHGGKDVVKFSAGVLGGTLGGSNIVVRVYDVDAAQTIASVTIPASTRMASTTTITTPTLVAGHLIRFDVTSAPAGVDGLHAWMKVDKS
jgi:hypothetical protein